MKTIFYLFLFICLSSCNLIQKHYLGLSINKKSKFIVQPFEKYKSAETGLFSINSSDLNHYLNESDSEFIALFFYTYWCSNSDKIISEFNELNIETLFISPNDWIYKQKYLDYLNSKKINKAFLLDVDKYGSVRNVHKKMKHFIEDLCDDCDSIGGFPSVIVFNKNNDIIYKNTGLESLEKVENIIK